MSNEEITEVTLVERPRKRGAFWRNIFALGLLLLFIQSALYFKKQSMQKIPLPEEIEKHIVMEDIENDKPYVEANTVEIPAAETVKPIEEKPLEVEIVTEAKPVVVKKPLVQAEPDPYTAGGLQDLDHSAIREDYKKGNVLRTPVGKKSSPSTSATPTEFIPYEN